METFGCLEAEMALKDVWKCAAEVSGALSVEISGMMWMLKLSATSSDFQTQVCSLLLAYAKMFSFITAWLGYFSGSD